jgi:hypothetical protein
MYVTRTAAPGPRHNTHHIHHIKCVDHIRIDSTLTFNCLCASNHRALDLLQPKNPQARFEMRAQTTRRDESVQDQASGAGKRMAKAHCDAFAV